SAGLRGSRPSSSSSRAAVWRSPTRRRAVRAGRTTSDPPSSRVPSSSPRSCRPRGAWRSARSLGLGIAAIGVVSAGLLVTGATGYEPPRLGLYDVGFLAAGVLFLIAVAIEFREHVARED